MIKKTLLLTFLFFSLFSFSQRKSFPFYLGFEIESGATVPRTNTIYESPQFIIGGTFLTEWQVKEKVNVGIGVYYSQRNFKSRTFSAPDSLGPNDWYLLKRENLKHLIGLPINFKFSPIVREKGDFFIGINAKVGFLLTESIKDTYSNSNANRLDEYNTITYAKSRFHPSVGLSLGGHLKFDKMKLRIESYIDINSVFWKESQEAFYSKYNFGLKLAFLIQTNAKRLSDLKD